MDMHLISIIVPAYNIAPYIARCLESLLRQTCRNLEIIVVNDGSTDGTGAVIDDFAAKDSRIVAIHKENGGVSSARLAGIAAAKGDYIGFVDGDDYVGPEMFEHLLKNALEYHADISHCGYQMVFPDGHVDMYYNTGKRETMNRDTGVLALVRGEYVEPGLWNKLYKHQIVAGIEQSPLWDSTIRINEDLLMNYILFSAAEKSVYEDISFYHYILRKGSAATSKPKRFKITDPVRVMQIILRDARNEPTIYCAVVERYLRVLIGTAQQEAWPEEAQKAKLELKEKIKEFRTVSGISSKVRVMAFGVAYMQPMYKLVRKVYNKFTGVDKKYDLD